MTPATPDAPSIAAVEAALRARTGLVLEGPRRADLDTSLRKLLTGTDPELWAETLQANPALFDQVIAAVTVGETYFFRDPEHFTYLREDFLPNFRMRKPGAVLHAWSAGCSTGEEAYSLAALFDELGASAEVLATDISRASLAKAKAAVYGRWSLRGDGARLMDRVLLPAERRDTYAVIPRIKKQVRFAYFNLAEGGLSALTPAGGMDVIFCRNVLIYLEPAAIQRVARRLYACLGEGGVLITGPSDPLLAEAAPFACDFTPSGVRYTKTAGRRAVPSPDQVYEQDPPFVIPEYVPPRPAPVTPTAATAVRDEARDLAALRLRANTDIAGAVEAAAAAAKTYPASPEFPYLQAILLINLGRHAEAESVIKRLIYVDPSLAVAHFALGNLRLRAGDLAGAKRAFTAAGKAAAARPADEILALSEGDTAGQMAAAAAKLTPDIPARRTGW